MGHRVDRTNAHTFVRVLAAAAIASSALLLVAGNAAASKSLVGWTGSPGGAAAPPGFSLPVGVDVNQPSIEDGSLDPYGNSTDGYVYVADTRNHTIRVFDPGLNQVFAFGGAVNQTSGGNLCPRPGFPADVCVRGNDVQAGRGYLDDVTQVAIDQQDGSVYVTDRDNLRVQKFTAAGEFLYMVGKGVNETEPAANICPRPGNAEDACKTGVTGTEGADFASTFSADVNVVPAGAPNAGNFLVGDKGNRRISEFESDGSFVRTFGWDVIKPGSPGDVSGNEVQRVRITAGGGTFTLSFSGNTAPIKYDASPAEVEAALEALAAVDDVEVTGGPGDPEGSNPYEITFVGEHEGGSVIQLGINASQLKAGIGHTLSCGAGNVEVSEYRWLRNGQPIPNTDSPTYTTVAADEGRGIQCELTGRLPALNGQDRLPTVGMSNPVGIAPPLSPELPVGPTLLPGMQANPFIEEGGPGSNTVGPCNPGNWQNSPFSYSYRWYLNGELIPGAEASTYVTKASDVAQPGVIQCVLLGTNASGTTARETTPNPSWGGVADRLSVFVTPEPAFGSVETVTNGGGFEVCTVATDCKAASPVNSGNEVGQFANGDPSAVAADSSGAILGLEANGLRRVHRFEEDGGSLKPAIWGAESHEFNPRPIDLTVAPDDEVLMLWLTPGDPEVECSDGEPPVAEYRVRRYSNDGEDLLEEHLECARLGTSYVVASNEQSGDLYVSSTNWDGVNRQRVWVANEDQAPAYAVAGLTATETTIVVDGEVTPNTVGSYANSPAALYRVEYRVKGEPEWQQLSDLKSGGTGVATNPISEVIPDLLPNSEYEVRIAGHKDYVGPGASSAVATATTTAALPQINAVSSSDLSAAEASLDALIDPRGSQTTYYFEWGPTTEYGNVTEVEAIGDGQGPVKVSERLSGLNGGTYHFRVVASNDVGTVTSVDQTFNFYPEKCPNELVRQQTKAQFLPDCRAYEIASAAEAGGLLIFPSSGVSSGEATSPSRLAYSGAFGATPGSGDPINMLGDLYVSTRGENGWTTKYVGLPSWESAYNGPRPGLAIVEGTLAISVQLAFTQRDVLTDRAMSRFVNWNRGNPTAIPNIYWSNAPFVWSATGQGLGRWPTNLAEVEGGEKFLGEMRASADLEHFVFSSNVPFTPEGQPGDIYDNDVNAGTIEPISRDEQGEPFQGAPVEVSEDGSRVLMSGVPSPPCIDEGSCPEIPQAPLYMRAGGQTFEVTDGQDARFAGMTDDGSTVYFTSEAQVTPDDTDASTDLFVWRISAPDSIERVSAGLGGAGNADDCEALEGWIQGCGAVPVSQWRQTCNANDMCTPYPRFFAQYSFALGGRGGNGIDDNFVAEDSGDVYFISPETLLGPGKGLDDYQNLYVLRGGELRFVARLNAQVDCIGESSFDTVCSEFGVARMEVTPDGRYASFITRSRLTAFDNDGHAMMYRYDAVADRLECLSCPPDGSKPTGRVIASLNGRYMTDDGRVFFSTEDGLVPRDTNEATDVYEYVDGRAQLITQGTGPKVPEGGLVVGREAIEGLVAVSRDGVDAYFSTFDVLTAADRNGGNLKIYDARVSGGFRHTEPLPGCEAADECRGDTSSAPKPPIEGTTANLGDTGDAPVEARGRCGALGNRARKLIRKANSARRGSRRAGGAAKRRLAKREKRLRKRAKRIRKNAQRCRARASRAGARTEVGR